MSEVKKPQFDYVLYKKLNGTLKEIGKYDRQKEISERLHVSIETCRQIIKGKANKYCKYYKIVQLKKSSSNI